VSQAVVRTPVPTWALRGHCDGSALSTPDRRSPWWVDWLERVGDCYTRKLSRAHAVGRPCHGREATALLRRGKTRRKVHLNS
jgi:hypothetical protein